MLLPYYPRCFPDMALSEKLRKTHLISSSIITSSYMFIRVNTFLRYDMVISSISWAKSIEIPQFQGQLSLPFQVSPGSSRFLRVSAPRS